MAKLPCCSILVLLCAIPAAHATNFTQCFADLTSALQNNVTVTLTGSFSSYSPFNLSMPIGTLGLTDDYGNLVTSASQASAVGYDLCMGYCGGGQEPFQWMLFSQNFSAWLLPWLALVSQLPFGAQDGVENFMSVVLAVGSPTLAVYSLALTVLNGRWIAQRLSGISYPNVEHAFSILNGLQQVSVKVTDEGSLLTSLIALRENDTWWTVLAEGLDFSNTWSLASAASVAWVVIAFFFTINGSLVSIQSDSVEAVDVDGQAVGSLWLWLLPVVIGWLQISPKCDHLRLKKAVSRANEVAFVATGKAISRVGDVTDRRALVIGYNWEDTREWEEHTPGDEHCTAPIFNYSRFYSWTRTAEEVAEVFRNVTRRRAFAFDVQFTHSRSDTIFSSSTVVDNFEAPPARRSFWGPGVWSRFMVASLVALLVQWSTTGSAIITVWFTPSVGFGCRSGSYVVYGVASTVVWALLVLSTMLTHFSSRRLPRPTRFIRTLAIVLRRLGKTLALFNCTWVVLACLFQFTGFFDRCYCNCDYTSLGRRAYDIILVSVGDISAMKNAWYGGVFLAMIPASLFTAFVTLFREPKVR